VLGRGRRTFRVVRHRCCVRVGQVREKAVRYIVNQMDRYLISQRDFGSGLMVRIRHFVAKICCLFGGRDYGNYLI